MPRKRSPKRGVLDFAHVVDAVPELSSIDEGWRGRGYERTRMRAWRRRDGTFTIRAVWRKRGELVSAVTCTLEGVALA
jgi:hypothetical protein